MENFFYTIYASSVGTLTLFATDTALTAITWPDENHNRIRLPAAVLHPDHPILIQTKQELDEYFSNKRKVFSIPILLHGTNFQKRVWQLLHQIPFSVTQTYKSVAENLGSPKAVRAVATAIGKNPISIIIPCHRIIGIKGNLCGFAGGLEAKQQLLYLESYGTNSL